MSFVVCFALAKHVLLDIVLQQVWYMPNKELAFGRDVHVHVSVVSVPWLFLGKYAGWSRAALCFFLEYCTHWCIDVLKTRYRKRRCPTGVAKLLMHCTDQALHAAVLAANVRILQAGTE